jgi:hypothetical protein
MVNHVVETGQQNVAQVDAAGGEVPLAVGVDLRGGQAQQFRALVGEEAEAAVAARDVSRNFAQFCGGRQSRRARAPAGLMWMR